MAKNTEYVPDSQILANQAKAKAMGITIPGLAPKPEPTAGEIYKNVNINAGDTASDAAYNKLGSYYEQQANQDVNEQSIYRNQINQYQKEIDAVNDIYQQKIGVAKQEGEGRLGSQRAIGARSGVLGSDFGNAQRESVLGQNTGIMRGIQAEQRNAIATIEAKARSGATDELKAKREAKKAGADSYLAYLGSQSERRSKKATDLASQFLAQGIDPSEVDPAKLKEIASQMGVKPEDIASAYASSKSEKDASDKKLDLETRKSEAEIKKIDADIAKGKLIELSEGAMLYNPETGETFKNPKTYEPKDTPTAAGIYGLLDYRTANSVISQADKFASTPIVQTYNGLVGAQNMLNGIDPNSQNPADHQAVVYNFAKMLDPDSVVREGEYATIKKYSQGLASKYKGEINQAVSGNGFLSPEAIAAMQAAAKNRVQAYKPQYDNLKTQTASRINQIAGQDVADMVLLDYSLGDTAGSNTAPDPQSEDPEYDAYLQSIGQ